ncbi:MAG TPA: histidinol-phosphatase [Methanocorpusculum sp.]|nr:histidinol-phosphatase [Methanocorpusculum sp.]
MQDFDLHVHSTFSDGVDTPEDIVREALDLGMKRIGISDHSYLKDAEDWCMREEDIPRYRRTIADLKEKYRGKIEVLCGIEQDLFSPKPAIGFDYVIGSVHFLRNGTELAAVDETPDVLQDAANRWFDGDMYKVVQLYYREVSQVVAITRADIIGHVDLITKFNENSVLFDEADSRYLDVAHTALDTLLDTQKPFEINFGAIIRGYRSVPYPSPDLQRYIVAHGGSFVLSSDSHAKGTLCYGFNTRNL